MMKNVLIKIKSLQGIEDETETIEMSVCGKLGIKDNEVLISYDEPDTIGSKGVKTRLRYKAPDTVILSRSGALESRLEIRKNTRSSCLYSTAVGDMMLGIFGEKVECLVDENGGTINLSYSIDANSRLLSRNQVDMSISVIN